MASGNQRAAFSIPSILAVIAAFFSFRMEAFGGFVLACVAIGFGLLGLLLSLSPSVRGGIISIIGVLAGLIGIIAAIIKIF